MPRLQIHIGGAKRSGKTTLARAIADDMRGMCPVIIDVDEVKVKIFGTETGLPDSEESLRFHRWTQNAMYRVLLPAVIRGGGVPIVVETHSDISSYTAAQVISAQYQTELKFFLLEPPTLKEATRRAAASIGDNSDMKDFSNPAVVASFEKSVAKVRKTYANVDGAGFFRVKQNTPKVMATAVLSRIYPIE
jgi:hypothetical protein